MRAFTFDALPGRVVFGVGSLALLPDEVGLLGSTRVLVLTDPATAEAALEVERALGRHFVGTFRDIQQHVPI